MKLFKTTLTVLTVTGALIYSLGNAEGLSHGSYQAIARQESDCRAMGRLAAKGNQIAREQGNVGLWVAQATNNGVIAKIGTTFNELEAGLVNQGYAEGQKGVPIDDSASMGYAKCMDNWERAARDLQAGTSTRWPELQ